MNLYRFCHLKSNRHKMVFIFKKIVKHSPKVNGLDSITQTRTAFLIGRLLISEKGYLGIYYRP